MLIYKKKDSNWEVQNEKSKILVRWLLLVSVIIYLLNQILPGNIMDNSGVHGTFNIRFIATLSIISVLLNLVYHFFIMLCIKYDRKISFGWKYVTMIFDFTIVSFVLLPTGGDKSIFFLIYFVIILSNGLRYGMRLVLSGLLTFNLCYLGVLFYQYYPDFLIADISTESIKITGFWIIGLYIGYLSRRFEHLHEEVEHYKSILSKLPGNIEPDE